MMDFTCSFPPGPHSIEWAQRAEELGYGRVYLHDSPALYWDVWVTLARVADSTDHVGLGALVIPHLRHVLTTASAIATIEDIAPGRLAVVVGTGFTARAMLGQRPLPWSRVDEYIRALRTLLRGDTVEVDGRKIAMRHPESWAPARPIEVPIIVAANGPKGLEVAHTVGDGVYSLAPVSGFDWPYLRRRAMRPGISFSASMIFLRPRSARERSRTLWGRRFSTAVLTRELLGQ
jgi:5,10-methylenetetrahydromethanopterin reductase